MKKKSYLIKWKFDDGNAEFNAPIDIELERHLEYTAKELYEKITKALEEALDKSFGLKRSKIRITGIYQL